MTTAAPEQVKTAQAPSPTGDEPGNKPAAPHIPDANATVDLNTMSSTELDAFLTQTAEADVEADDSKPTPPAPKSAEAPQGDQPADDPKPEEVTPPEQAATETEDEKKEKERASKKARIYFPHLSDLNSAALDILKRNPDLTPAQAEDMAREALGMAPRVAPKADDPKKPENPQATEPQTIEELRAAIETEEREYIAKSAELDEDAALAKRRHIYELNRKLVRAEIKAEDAETARQSKFEAARQESLQRVAEDFPDAMDPDSELYSAAFAAFDELKQVDPSIEHSPFRYETCIRHAARKLGTKPATAPAKAPDAPTPKPTDKPAPPASSAKPASRTPAPIGPAGGGATPTPTPSGNNDPFAGLDQVSDAQGAAALDKALSMIATAEASR